MFGATAVQYVTWQAGTLVGALSGNVLGDRTSSGSTRVYPAFFLAILMVELRRPGGPVVALAGAPIALVLIPFTPAGVPVLAASVAAFTGCGAAGGDRRRGLGGRRRRRRRDGFIKGVGPFALGGRELPAWFSSVVVLLAPALLAALVVAPTLPTARTCTWAPTPRASRWPGSPSARGVGDRRRRDRRRRHGGGLRAV